MDDPTEILLCSDLDRTILPNGEAPESPGAREVLRRIARRAQIRLVYVSGRNRKLIQDAIENYRLPLPDFAIGDVGTTIYDLDKGSWNKWSAWNDEISKDWPEGGHDELAGMLSDMAQLRPQESEKQNRFKLSYYTDADADQQVLVQEIRQRLKSRGVRPSVIWSVDEQRDVGLIDVLPERANKVHAVRFLAKSQGISKNRVVYAGDSGNDLAVMVSDIQSILVRNAAETVRREARESVEKSGLEETLYEAKGGFLGMNGNYTAGVLEGLAHFLPVTREWIEKALVGSKSVVPSVPR
ncbi:MAG: HAD-IIB family hydrolase [Desulfobacterales bacterium]|jgi:sucrose-6F-phosphate phosphohydrolase|nr:HAD-IIB family hydrolase [Desulfobacterales bacterium]